MKSIKAYLELAEKAKNPKFTEWFEFANTSLSMGPALAKALLRMEDFLICNDPLFQEQKRPRCGSCKACEALADIEKILGGGS